MLLAQQINKHTEQVSKHPASVACSGPCDPGQHSHGTVKMTLRTSWNMKDEYILEPVHSAQGLGPLWMPVDASEASNRPSSQSDSLSHLVRYPRPSAFHEAWHGRDGRDGRGVTKRSTPTDWRIAS